MEISDAQTMCFIYHLRYQLLVVWIPTHRDFWNPNSQVSELLKYGNKRYSNNVFHGLSSISGISGVRWYSMEIQNFKTSKLQNFKTSKLRDYWTRFSDDKI
jgi:hypothetical protein